MRLFVLLALLWPTLVGAQAPARVLNYCQSLTEHRAFYVRQMVKLNANDERIHIRNESSWEKSVISYMIQKMRSHPELSEKELRILGYTYCVERRPN